MNYRLCICEDGNYQVVDLRKVLRNKAKNLEDIDGFTMIFKNSRYLTDYLALKEILSEDDVQKQVVIEYGDEIKRTTRPLYSSDRELLLKIKSFALDIKIYFNDRKHESIRTKSYEDIMEDYPYIETDFKEFKNMLKNISFLKALQTFISSNPKQQESIKIINDYINSRTRDPYSKNINIALYEAFRRIFFKYNSERKDLVFNYKGFRNFLIFYIDFKERYNNKKNSGIKEVMEEEYDDYVEPLFPPNSEEEKIYNDYMNNLPDEEHPHKYR